MPQCHNATMPQCHNATMPQCHNATMGQYAALRLPPRGSRCWHCLRLPLVIGHFAFDMLRFRRLQAQGACYRSGLIDCCGQGQARREVVRK